ncbi:hypothetical protein [Haloarchaeobius salinus]|uniref:hypothetical protein n=1 Tax=Haloarchaeobius salinus TaxID=1198298 RepID=UPI00210F1405|nr:hypothetical protein [Haloarchaeobius salinus]
MNKRSNRSLAGNLTLLLGLLLFVAGASVVVFDYQVEVPLPVLGTLALVLVGVGAATRNADGGGRTA